MSSLAVGGTAAAVAAGVAFHHPTSSEGTTELSATGATFTPPTATETPDPSLVADRRAPVSRAFDRGAAAIAPDPAKRAALATVAGRDHGSAVTHTEDIGDSDPKTIASALLSSYGWGGDQFSCLESLWNKESGWRVNAYNPSGAYGIPQALPGSKMASAGPDWETDAETQIKWGLGYIRDRYGSPCGAWGHSESYNWY